MFLKGVERLANEGALGRFAECVSGLGKWAWRGCGCVCFHWFINGPLDLYPIIVFKMRYLMSLIFAVMRSNESSAVLNCNAEDRTLRCRH